MQSSPNGSAGRIATAKVFRIWPWCINIIISVDFSRFSASSSLPLLHIGGGRDQHETAKFAHHVWCMLLFVHVYFKPFSSVCSVCTFNIIVIAIGIQIFPNRGHFPVYSHDLIFKHAHTASVGAVVRTQCGIPQSSVSLSHDVMNNARRILHFSHGNSRKMPSANSWEWEENEWNTKMPATERALVVGPRSALGTRARVRAYVHFVQFMLHWKLLFIFIYFLRFSQWQYSLVIFCAPIGRQLESHAALRCVLPAKTTHSVAALVCTWEIESRRDCEKEKEKKSKNDGLNTGDNSCQL